jgi:DNA-binding PadR family transcriptional regulator
MEQDNQETKHLQENGADQKPENPDEHQHQSDHNPEERAHLHPHEHGPDQNSENRHDHEHQPDHNPEERGHIHHRHGDFWREWREEQRHVIREVVHEVRHDFRHPMSQDPTPEEIGAWREYFKNAMGNWPEKHWIFGGRRFSPWHQGIDNFNPFVASLLSKGGGLLPLYVLYLVSQKPRYGNEIMDILAERTGGQWVSNPGAIYPLLTLLEREEFIHGEWEDPQKRTVRIYTITKTGQDEYDRVKGIMGPKIEETVKVLQEFLRDLESNPEATTESPAEQPA